jgi:WD40 repeat protein
MTTRRILLGLLSGLAISAFCASGALAQSWKERQLTTDKVGHILTNTNVFSPDSQWIAYDERSDREGSVFDSLSIKRVNVRDGRIETLYTARNGAFVGVVTYDQTKERVVFIHGPENPTKDWDYGGSRREGTIVETGRPGVDVNLDARDLTPPFTPGALRGGSHVHVYEPKGDWLSFTYQDNVLERLGTTSDHDIDQRNVGVSIPGLPVVVDKGDPRNRDGSTFTVLVTRTVNAPRPGSDEINRAYEEGWVGTAGYVKTDGSRQRHAIAFLGDTVGADGKKLTEVFLADLPEDLTKPSGDGPLEGTATTRPLPPAGVTQKRLTFTSARKNPGIQGPRFWVRSSPDGEQLAFLMKDDAGLVQIYTVSPRGGAIRQITRNAFPVASTLSWSPDGTRIAYAGDDGIHVTDVATGETTTVAPKDMKRPTLAIAVAFSPDGRKIAYQRVVSDGDKAFNQIFVAEAAD